MDNGRRNRDKELKDSNIPVKDKNETAATSTNNRTEVKIDGGEATEDSQRSDKIQAASNLLNVPSELTEDKKEGRNRDIVDKPGERCLYPALRCILMDHKGTMEIIDQIEKSVTNFLSTYGNNSEILAETICRTKDQEVPTSLLEIHPGLAQFIQKRHRDDFLNGKKALTLNAKTKERLCDIFYLGIKTSKLSEKTKFDLVRKVFATIAQAKILKDEDGTNKINAESQNSDTKKSADDIQTPTHLPQKLIVQKKYKIEGRDGHIQKDEGKESELMVAEKKDISSSDKEPITTVAKSESHENTTTLASHAGIKIQVEDPAQPDEGRKREVVKLKKNDNIDFRFEADGNVHVSAVNNKYSYELDEKKDIAFDVEDENIQIVFTGNNILISTPNSEFGISIRKSDPLNLKTVATQTDVLT